MTTSGRNMKITVAKEHRALVRTLFGEVFGCTVKAPNPALDVFLFEDGYSLGAFSVEAADALSPADHTKAPWLEFFVADPAKTQRDLHALGIDPFEYVDKEHTYFAPVSGPVFRLAKRQLA